MLGVKVGINLQTSVFKGRWKAKRMDDGWIDGAGVLDSLDELDVDSEIASESTKEKSEKAQDDDGHVEISAEEASKRGPLGQWPFGSEALSDVVGFSLVPRDCCVSHSER